MVVFLKNKPFITFFAQKIWSYHFFVVPLQPNLFKNIYVFKNIEQTYKIE